MDAFFAEIESVLRKSFGTGCRIESIQSVGGGCINQACCLELDDHKKLFVKRNRLDLRPMFESEAKGLLEISQTQTVRVPLPIGYGAAGDQSYLILEWIDPVDPAQASSSRARSRQLGNALAKLHRFSGSDAFGLGFDNFIGSSPQPNAWSPDWPEFYLEHRLEFQVRLAIEKGYQDVVAQSSGTLDRMRSVLRTHPRPRLIHGDLWSGNYMTGSDGEPVFVDPAPYWADREAEFGILTLFGGFDSDFFDAYAEQIPFDDGYSERLPVYQLYHYLNHLNLFGVGYAAQVQSILAQFK